VMWRAEGVTKLGQEIVVWARALHKLLSRNGCRNVWETVVL
jgi:hypothetical protein